MQNYSSMNSVKEKDEKDGNCCETCCFWMLQIFVWASLVCFIVVAIVASDGIGVVAGIFGFFYIIYLIANFCSSTCKYLSNKKTGLNMYNKMGQIFQTAPHIKFTCECYHMEKRREKSTDAQGKVTYSEHEVRVVSHRDSMLVPYYSFRDVSGLFLLDCDKAIVNRKAYIQLKLEEEINFADPVSIYDYNYYKDYFWRMNRFRDIYMDFRETREIPGLIHHNLIKLSDNEPGTVNVCLFILLTFIPFVEFYKIYVNSFCVYQKFRIRKLVSTRYDLNAPQITEQYNYNYNQLQPQLNLVSQSYSYDANQYYNVNAQVEVDLPTEEEIQAAEQYRNQVPNYQVTSVGGNMSGQISQNQVYDNYGNNQPPAAFAQYQGALAPNLVNSNGNLPNGFAPSGFSGKAPDVQRFNQNYGQPYHSNLGYSGGPGYNPISNDSNY